MGKFKEIEIEEEDDVNAKQMRLFDAEYANPRGGLVKLDVASLSYYLEMLRREAESASSSETKESAAQLFR